MGELATVEKRSLIESMADAAGLEPDNFYAAVQEACGCKGAQPEHFMALLMQCRTLGLDPMSRHMWLIPAKGGVKVDLSIDGYMKLMLAHPQYLNHVVEVKAVNDKPFSATCTVWRKDQHAAGLPPSPVTEYFAECQTNGGPWRSHPFRMLRHRAVMQAARNSFGIYVPDAHEWQRAEEVEGGQLPAPPASGSPLDQLTDSLPAVGGPVIDALAEATSEDPIPLSKAVEVAAEFDAEESRRLDAEDAAREADEPKKPGSLFGH